MGLVPLIEIIVQGFACPRPITITVSRVNLKSFFGLGFVSLFCLVQVATTLKSFFFDLGLFQLLIELIETRFFLSQTWG